MNTDAAEAPDAVVCDMELDLESPPNLTVTHETGVWADRTEALG
jgi:hypothetical protein